MPRRNYKGRRVSGGLPWRGRHKLDHREVPQVIQKMIESDERPARPAVRRGPAPAEAADA